MENAWLPQFSLRIPTALDKICFSRVDIFEPRKNTSVLAGTVLHKPEFLAPPRNAQNVCAVTKGGTVQYRETQ